MNMDPVDTNGAVDWRVRMGMGLLAVPQLATGLWAVIDPHGWFRGFPGFGTRLVVAAGATYNGHLASDAGAGFLATGIGLVVAVVIAKRAAAQVALVTYLAFSIAHFVFHASHPVGSYWSSTNIENLASTGIAVAFPLLLCVWAFRRRAGVPASARVP
jgi:hypothetical protein